MRSLRHIRYDVALTYCGDDTASLAAELERALRACGYSVFEYKTLGRSADCPATGSDAIYRVSRVNIMLASIGYPRSQACRAEAWAVLSRMYAEAHRCDDTVFEGQVRVFDCGGLQGQTWVVGSGLLTASGTSTDEAPFSLRFLDRHANRVQWPSILELSTDPASVARAAHVIAADIEAIRRGQPGDTLAPLDDTCTHDGLPLCVHADILAATQDSASDATFRDEPLPRPRTGAPTQRRPLRSRIASAIGLAGLGVAVATAGALVHERFDAPATPAVVGPAAEDTIPSPGPSLSTPLTLPDDSQRPRTPPTSPPQPPTTCDVSTPAAQQCLGVCIDACQLAPEPVSTAEVQ
ncbi:MAG: hypothetical protein K0V04_32220 [Deltaproteobacteria bacterium]|nr:hypothetical protein [Deltaproteobacteria bacterium]